VESKEAIDESGRLIHKDRASLVFKRSLQRDMVIRREIAWQKDTLFFSSDDLVNTIYFRLRLYYTWDKLKIVY
jgi:hypothetical protein